MLYRRNVEDDWQARKGLPRSAVIGLALDPTSPPDRRVLYASVWEHGVFRSDDGGCHWEHRSNGLGSPGRNMRTLRIERATDGALLCLVTTLRKGDTLIREGVGLYRSDDEGRSWRELTAELDVRWTTDFAIDAHDPGVIYLSVADHIVATSVTGDDRPEIGAGLCYEAVGGLYRTDDAGRSWRRVARMSNRHFGATPHPTRPGWVYMTLHATVPEEGEPSTEASLWLSRDRGEHWEPFRDFRFGNTTRVHIDPVDPLRIYVTTYGGGVWRGPAQP